MNDKQQTMSELRAEAKALNLEIPKNASREVLERLISEDVARTAAELNALVPGIVRQPANPDEPVLSSKLPRELAADLAAAEMADVDTASPTDEETVDEAAARQDDEMFGRQDHDLEDEPDGQENEDEAGDEDQEPIVSLGATQVTMYYPSATVGEVTEHCTHVAWGHQAEAAARKCMASLVTKATAAQQ